MNSSPRMFIAAWLLVVVTAASVLAEDGRDSPSAKVDRSELQDKQLDVSLEARDIERVLGKLKRASDLAKQRITEAAQTTESVSGALDRGDSQSAKASAAQAAEMFQEIVKQLEALLQEETPQRVAAARNLAQQLAKAERQFAQQFPGAMNPVQGGGQGKLDPKSSVKPTEPESGDMPPGSQPGAGKKMPPGEKQPTGAGSGNGEQDNSEDQPPRAAAPGGGQRDMTAEERAEALAARAEQLAASAATLQDILQAIAQSPDPADRAAVEKIESLVGETKLTAAVEAARQSAAMIRAGQLDDAQLAAQDIAERMEIAAQRLDAAYRTIVAPQAEELRDMEQTLAGLREELEQLETPAQVSAWHRQVRELLDELDAIGISEEAREEFLEEMRKAGFSPDSPRAELGWALVAGRYAAPESYHRALVTLQEDVQERLQSLILDDIGTAPDEATPPKYQDLVDRYYQILSSGGRGKKPETAEPPRLTSPDK